MFARLGLLLVSFWAACAYAGPNAAELPKAVEINGVEFVLIPEGWIYFPVPDVDPVTGNSQGAGIREVKLWIDAYYLAKYESRGRDLAKFLNSGQAKYAAHYEPGRTTYNGAEHGCAVRKNPEGQYYELSPEGDLPATHLSWDLANEFAGWMGFRLASEAEWVRAFRGDTKQAFPWGDEYPDDTYAGFQEGATECDVRPVTAYPKGQSPFGVFNMSGNVFEYVADWYNKAHYAALRDGDRNPVSAVPQAWSGPTNTPKRVLRGGRWASGVGELSLYGNRDLQATDSPFRCYGTRFAVDAAVVLESLKSGAARVR